MISGNYCPRPLTLQSLLYQILPLPLCPPALLPLPSQATNYWLFIRPSTFLVADTQLYKSLCPSVRPSIRPSGLRSIRPSARVEKWVNAHIRPCPPVRNWYWPCIRPCSFIFFRISVVCDGSPIFTRHCVRSLICLYPA